MQLEDPVMATDSFSVFVAALAASSAAIFLFFFIYFTKFKHQKSAKLPPGSLGWPFIGETLDYLQTGRGIMDDTFVRTRMEKYDNRVFKTSLYGNPVACFCGTAGNKFFFSNENKLFAAWSPVWLERLVGPSLGSKIGDEAKWIRRMIMGFLNPESMQQFVATVDMVTQHQLRTHWEGQNEVKAYPLIKKFNFVVACRFFMSIDDPERISKLYSLFSIIIKGITSLHINFPGTNYYNALRAAEAFKGEIKEMIKGRRREALKNKADASPLTQDLLSHLVLHPDETGKFMPESQVISNMLELFIAGQDTTSSVLTILVKYLAELPEVYERVFKEQMDIAMAKGPEELLNWEDMKKMRYSGNVISELMRLAVPLADNVLREALVDFTYAGYTIPKGWKCMWSNAPHIDPKIFPNPKNFDPSRFEGEALTPYTYNPFGGGPRMCPGRDYARVKLLVFLHNMVKRFKWELLSLDEEFPTEIMPVPSKGLPLRLLPHHL